MNVKAFALAAVLPAMASCADLDEQVFTGVTGAYFGTPKGARAAITAAYATQELWTSYLMEHPVFFAGTDSWEKGDQAAGAGDAPFNDYTPVLAANMSNPLLRYQWQFLYLAVNAANTAIHYISASTEIPEPDKSTLLGEGRFLRALHYFLLVRMWGAVSLSLEPTEGVVTTASRTSTDSIYALAIIPDLEFAVAKLPATQAEEGRATRGAAQALLAEVYLTRAQPADFDRARDLADAVIGSATYALNPSFLRLFCGPKYPEACEFVAASESDREFIYAVQHSDDRVHDQWGNTLHLVWAMAYDVGGAANPTLPRQLQYGRPYRRLKPTPHLLNLWNRTTDGRYDATFQTLWKYPSGDTAIYFPGTETVPTQYQGRPYRTYGQSQYTNKLYPTLRKWLDDKRASVNEIPSARDRHLWRLADVYLLRAEANIRAGRVADAIPDLNVLRTRAALPGKDNTLTAAEIAQLQATPIDFLLDERERELAGEEYRWFVLARLHKLVARVQTYNAAAKPNVQSFHELRPIPQEQIDRTRGGAAAFPQNPGY